MKSLPCRPLLLAPLLALLLGAIPLSALDVDEVLTLHRAGLEAETLVSVVQASGQVFRLETSEILALKKAGVDERVIRALVATALPRGDAPRLRTEVQEDGSILLTDEGVPPAPSEPERSSARTRRNTVPARPAGDPDRTRAYPMSPVRMPAPPSTTNQINVYPPSATAPPPETGDRGRYGIGYRWHPSWDQDDRLPHLGPVNHWPFGADVDVGWNAAGGYYFLPAAVGPDGPSSFGRFGFHLLPSPQLQPHLHRGRTHVSSPGRNHRSRFPRSSRRP